MHFRFLTLVSSVFVSDHSGGKKGSFWTPFHTEGCSGHVLTCTEEHPLFGERYKRCSTLCWSTRNIAHFSSATPPVNCHSLNLALIWFLSPLLINDVTEWIYPWSLHLHILNILSRRHQPLLLNPFRKPGALTCVKNVMSSLSAAARRQFSNTNFTSISVVIWHCGFLGARGQLAQSEVMQHHSQMSFLCRVGLINVWSAH